MCAPESGFGIEKSSNNPSNQVYEGTLPVRNRERVLAKEHHQHIDEKTLEDPEPEEINAGQTKIESSVSSITEISLAYEETLKELIAVLDAFELVRSVSADEETGISTSYIEHISDASIHDMQGTLILALDLAKDMCAKNQDKEYIEVAICKELNEDSLDFEEWEITEASWEDEEDKDAWEILEEGEESEEDLEGFFEITLAEGPFE